MKTWLVSVPITVSLTVRVRAKTKEKALERAKKAELQQFCHMCSEPEEGTLTIGGELDGDPNWDEAEVEESDAEVGED